MEEESNKSRRDERRTVKNHTTAATISPNLWATQDYNFGPEATMAVNWVGLEKIGEIRIVNALALALRSTTISEIARKTGIPESSLYSIRKHGPYEHRNRKESRS